MNDSFPDALPLETTLHGGDYSIEEILGQGGFGITYRAGDNTLHRAAAIKEFFPRGAARDRQTLEVLVPSPLEFQNAKEQFLSEARALAQFNHPNIVDVYSIFEESNTAYMVMEFVRGSTLSQLIAARGALPESEALKIIEQIGSALLEVHRTGLLHLDVKPDNIMLEAASTPDASNLNARAVLLDFGLTKKIERGNFATVRLDAWSRFGTPGFAAIEQYSKDGNVGIWTDIYGLAATLYFLLTGSEPPDAATRATGAPLPDVRTFEGGTNVSTPVAVAIERGLRLEPAQRPQSVIEFLGLLREEAAPPIQIIPAGNPVFDDASTPPLVGDAEEENYNDPFGLRDPNRPGPFRRPRTYNPRGPAANNPLGNSPFGNNPFGNSPFTFLPLGFGCSGIGCSMGCFLFIVIFFIFIASLLNSVGQFLRF